MSKSKKKKIISQQTTTVQHEQEQKSMPQNQAPMKWYEKMTSGWIPYAVFALLSLGIYSNTFNAQFALDDDIVICKNEYVLQGTKGMADIFSKDLFDSFYKQMNTTAQLAGGRYRPLSVATFAIEQEFIGTRDNANFEPTVWDTNQNGIEDPSEDINKDGLFNDKDFRSKGFGMRHFNNVLLYIVSVSLLFLFLSNVVFKKNKLLAFIISLLFLAHPIHTEVVANVKSRDEIMSFLFMMLSLILAHKYAIQKNFKFLILLFISFFCALLSKEYGATLLILIPLSLFLFSEEKFQVSKYIPMFVGLLIVFGIYYAIRSSIVIGESNLQDTELMNNPYLLADENQKMATKLFIYLKYFLLLLFPHPLSCDYGYNSIPYKNFSDPLVWIAIILLILTIVGGFIFFKKKSWVSFAIAFYLLTILLVTNLVFNVGATMGERLVFHSSLGFCMLLGYGIYWLGIRSKNAAIPVLISIPILLLYSIKTYSRNFAWQNDITLALTDVETMPESIALNGNAASRCIDLSEMPKNKSKEKEYILKSIQYGTKAVTLHPGFVNGFLNLGIAYAKMDSLDKASECWDKAFKMYPSHPNKKMYYDLLANSYYQKGYEYGGAQNWKEGQRYIQKAVDLNPTIARYWYDLGGFSYNAQDLPKAKSAWEKAYQLDPKDSLIRSVQGILK